MLSAQWNRPAAALVLFGGFMSACQDLPSVSDPVLSRDPPASEGVTVAAGHLPRASYPDPPYVCWISVRTPDGPHRYRYSWRGLRFPGSLVPADGATQIVRYRWRQSGGQEVQRYANCRIPRTADALELLDRRFRATERRRPSHRESPDDETVTILSVAPTGGGGGGGGDGNTCDWNDCDTSMGIGGGGGGGAGGGDNGDPGDPGDISQVPDDDTNDYAEPDCSEPQTTNYGAAFCRAADPEITGPRWTKTEEALMRIYARGGACAEIASRGMSLLQLGQIRYYAPAPGDAGGYADLDTGVLLSDYWVDKYATSRTGETPPRNLDQVLAHEIDHMNGLGHLADLKETPNSRVCSGI